MKWFGPSPCFGSPLESGRDAVRPVRARSFREGASPCWTCEKYWYAERHVTCRDFCDRFRDWEILMDANGVEVGT